MTDLDTVGVVGMGTMGAGIAQVVAASGRDVLVLDASQARCQAGLDAVRRFLAGGVARGKLSQQAAAQIAGRIRAVADVTGLAGCQLVIEAIIEQREAKRALLAEVGQAVAPDALIVTNTSALSVSDLAAAVPDPGRFAGLHFFNPAPLMRTVEVVRALQSRPEVVPRLASFSTSLGKEPVVVKDRPGFLVNYLLMPYLNDVIAEYDRELASAQDIDQAVRLGLGHRLGPLELADLIGLDVHAHATAAAYEATLDPRFAPPPLLTRMVSAGYLGNKNGKGLRTVTEEDA
jgi:3-hydroxybutyryl-CoA dehydrogenase